MAKGEFGRVIKQVVEDSFRRTVADGRKQQGAAGLAPVRSERIPDGVTPNPDQSQTLAAIQPNNPRSKAQSLAGPRRTALLSRTHPERVPPCQEPAT